MQIKIQQNDYRIFYLFLLLFILLLFARYGLQLEIPRVLLTIVISIIVLQGQKDEILAIAMSCIALHEAVDFYYSIYICIIIYIIKRYNYIKINVSALFVMGLILLELLHCFQVDFSIMNFLITITPLLFLIIVLCDDMSDINYGFIVRTMGVITLSIGISLLMRLVVEAGYNIMLAFSNLRRLGIDSAENAAEGGVINPNSLGIICVLIIVAYLQLRISEQKEKSDIIMLLLLLVLGALTTSRTFLVCFIITVILLLICQQEKLTKKVKFFAFIIIFIALAGALLYTVFPELVEYFISRFKGGDITTGRNDLMIVYHDYIMKNVDVMFWGIGLNDYSNQLVNILHIASNTPHNAIQEIIIAWGLPGLVFFALLIVLISFRAYKCSGNQTLLNYIPLIIVIAKSMAGQMITSSYTMLALSFAYLSLCQDFSHRNILEKNNKYNS